MANVPWFSLLTMVTLSATLSFMTDAQDCFGGIETFEKMVSMTFSEVVPYKPMLQQPGQAITRDCINLCKQQAACLSFGLSYNSSSCVSYNVNSVGRGDDIITSIAVNFFEKICFRGVSKQVFDSACRDKLWVFDRVRDAYLDGHVDKELKNIRTKEDCEKMCITEERFRCRSADYDEVQRICRMSRETRRTKPTSFRIVPGSMRNYLENQCAPPPPGTCRYDTRTDVTVATPDYLQFASSSADCMGQCGAETAFNCWSYSYIDNKCQLSGDSSATVGEGTELIAQPGAVYGELRCFFEHCDNGVMTFEKMTGVLLRSAQGTMMPVSTLGSLGNTLECIKYCLDEGMECPAFSDHYQNMRCDRLDRNSNGRTQELIARDGESYFEKICLQGPEAQACSERAWAFERTLGYELSDGLYKKTIPKVETRRECTQFCLSEREFICRSARYNEDTGECKLSPDDRRTEPGKYYRSEDARISYLENSCLPTESTCPYAETQDAYATYTNVIQKDEITTLESCRDTCTNFTKFPCRSFSYYSVTLQCFLSGDDKASGGSAAIQNRQGINYFERICPQNSESEMNATGSTKTDEESSTERSSVISSTTTEIFLETQTTTTMRPAYQPQAPSRPECAPSERLIFEKITGYEPFGVTSALLYRGDSTTPGISAECVRRCQALSDCQSFVLDHQRYECSSIQEPPVVHPSDFRSSIGKTFFGGICVPAYIGCSKLWVFERIMDHELQGVNPLDIIRVVSLEQCEQHCLETRKYVCKSANYFHLRRECHIFGEDRASAKSQLASASRVDYVENQCLIDTSYCPYQNLEHDQAMIYITKSVLKAPSTIHCERECNNEREFNCRSYTFWSLGGSTNVCMLSGESRLTGQALGLQHRQGATYANKICKSPAEGRESSTIHPPFPVPTKGTTASIPKATPTFLQSPPTPTHTSFRVLPRAVCTFNKYTYEKIVGQDVRSNRRERVPTRSSIGVLHQCHAECHRAGEGCRGFIIQYKSYQSCFIILGGPGEKLDLIPSQDTAFFEKVCLRGGTCGKYWTFERILNHELLADPIREITDVSERSECQDLCLQEYPTCHSASYHQNSRICQLYSDTRRSKPNHFHYSNDDVDYLENQCASNPPTCQYRDFPERFLAHIDRLSRAYSLQDCQRQCESEKQFICRSVNYEVVTRDCALSSEDTSGSTPSPNPRSLQLRRNSLYSEKGNCEQVTVQCNQQDMLLTINFESPFFGRVYAKGNPSQCFVVGTGQNNLQFAVSLGTRCGTKVQPKDRYVNEVVVQQHPVIMTDHDKTIKVVCSFETQERTYTMNGPGVDSDGMDVGRTNQRQQFTSLVTNTAPPPNVVMRLLDSLGGDARSVGIGDELTLKVELREPSSAFALFARNLYARSSNGESLFLIDSSGCPTDASIFPALQIDSKDRKSLYSTFKAFRFPSTSMVNFEVQIKFCQEKCEQVQCGAKGPSFGRKKRSAKGYDIFGNSSSTLADDEDVYFDHDNYEDIWTVIRNEPHSLLVPSSGEYNLKQTAINLKKPLEPTFAKPTNSVVSTAMHDHSVYELTDLDDEAENREHLFGRREIPKNVTNAFSTTKPEEYFNASRSRKTSTIPVSVEFNRKHVFTKSDNNSTSADATTSLEHQPLSPYELKEQKTNNNKNEENGPKYFSRPGVKEIGEIPISVSKPPSDEESKMILLSVSSFSSNNTTSNTVAGGGVSLNSNNPSHHLPLRASLDQMVVKPPLQHKNWVSPSNTFLPKHQTYSVFPSRPVEIQHIPNGWNQNVQSSVDVTNQRFPPNNKHSRNHFLINDNDDRQTRVMTEFPPVLHRPLNIQNYSPRWGSNSEQHQPSAHVQKPLEVIGDQSFRRNYPGFAPPPSHFSNQGRPVEIGNSPSGAYSHGESQSIPHSSHSYEFQRPIENPKLNPASHQNPSNLVHNSPFNHWDSRPGPSNPFPPTPRPIQVQSYDTNIHRHDQANRPGQRVIATLKPTRQGENSGDPLNRGVKNSPQPGRNNLYPPPYQMHSNDLVASTQQSIPEEVPLSLAILVGEDGKSLNSHNRQNHHLKPHQPGRLSHNQFNRGLPRNSIINTPRPDHPPDLSSDKVCTSKATVIATAISVTLVYLGIVAGALVLHRCYRRNRRKKEMAASPIQLPPNPANANAVYNTPDITFRNVYGNFPTVSTSTT